MRRSLLIALFTTATLAAAAVAALRRPTSSTPTPPTPAWSDAGPLRLAAQLERRWLRTSGTEAFLQIDVAATGAQEAGQRVPVNAVLVIDRSGSMAGEKIERARDAARALIAELNGEDRLAIVDFASDAQVLFDSAAATPAAKERALAEVARLVATSGTNLSAALDLAAPQLALGRAPGRIDKLFLASDGQANEGVVERGALLSLAGQAAAGATVSTFGVGEDYDEDLMTALASQAGGRTRFIQSAGELPPAFRAELSRASRAVAREVRLEVRGAGGARVERVLGYQSDGGYVRLPDFAAGETRRVLVKLSLPPGHGFAELAQVTLSFAGMDGHAFRAQAAAGATYTADARQLGELPNDAAVSGARAEMADLAQQAVQLFEAGRFDDARKAQGELRAAASKVARELPAAAAPVNAEAGEWDGMVQRSQQGGSARKEAKQKSFDAVRAPVAGW